jgi:hypothetical protein
MMLWGIERFLDERLWLTDPSHVAFILVQLAGVALTIAGLVVLVAKYPAYKKWRTDGPVEGGPFLGDPKPTTTPRPATPTTAPTATTPSTTLASGDPG